MSLIRKIFKVVSGDLVLCDMRPGFSADEVSCHIPKGDYRLTIEPAQAKNMLGFSLVLLDEKVTSESEHGIFSVDMARVGIFERKSFLNQFNGSGEALFDWSESAVKSTDSKWGGFLLHKKSGLEALYVNTGSDCQCIVQILRSGRRAVGVRVIPKSVSDHSPTRLGSTHWTCVELKCDGIGSPLSFLDDRDFDLDFDLLLDKVRFEVSSIDENGCLDPKVIDLDIPIAKYRNRYKGVAKISAFYKRSGESRRRIHLPKSYSIPKVTSKATSRKIAEVVFDIFKVARQ